MATKRRPYPILSGRSQLSKIALQFESPMHTAGYRSNRRDSIVELLAAAFRRGDVDRAFSLLELKRGKLLLDLWGSSANQTASFGKKTDKELYTIDRELKMLDIGGPKETEAGRIRERELTARKDKILLELVSQSKKGLQRPVLPTIGELQKTLSPDKIFITTFLDRDELFGIVVCHDRAYLVSQSGAANLRYAIRNFVSSTETQILDYQRGVDLRDGHVSDLNQRLAELG